jgi:hypothetical protein
MADHPALDHAIVHQDCHGSRVSIVPNADVDAVMDALRLVVPHQSVLSTPIGCGHRCVYTSDAPASLVAERISEHLARIAREGDAEPAPSDPGSTRPAHEEPSPDFFARDGHRR